MTRAHLGILCGSLSLLVLANAEFYRNVPLIRPQNGYPYTFQTFYHPAHNPVHTESRFSSEVAPHVSKNLSQNIVMASTQISKGSEMFSFDMFRSIANAVRNYDSNFIIAPFSIWSLMLLVAEGAVGQSYDQLQKTLRMPNDLNSLRAAYKNFQRLLLVNTSTVELAVNQALFSDINRPIEPSYANVLRNEYEADHLPLDFKAPVNAAKAINDHISLRTQGKIKDIIMPQDLTDTQLLLTSAIYFKGQWKFPFNVSTTKVQPFYNENGEFVANVPMMAQRKILPYSTIHRLDASVLELPYGKEDRLCMLLILPRRNSTLSIVFENLRNFDIAKMNHELHKYDNTDDYDETEIEFTLPRFKIDSDLDLLTVLEHLGITDIFDSAKANLSKMSRQTSYVSHVFHKAVIEVNEIGTEAAGAASATVSFKQSPIEVNFNRPFGFLITDKITSTLLFAGQVRHPLV